MAQTVSPMQFILQNYIYALVTSKEESPVTMVLYNLTLFQTQLALESGTTKEEIQLYQKIEGLMGDLKKLFVSPPFIQSLNLTQLQTLTFRHLNTGFKLSKEIDVGENTYTLLELKTSLSETEQRCTKIMAKIVSLYNLEIPLAGLMEFQK